MIKKNQRILNGINAVSDIVLICAAYIISMRLRFDVFGGHDSLALLSGNMRQIALVFSLMLVFGYYVMGLYESFRLKRIGSENAKIAVINAFGVLLLVAFLYLKHISEFSRWALAILFVLSSLFVIFKRLAVRLLLRYLRAKDYNQKHIAIVGDGFLAHQFVKDIKDRPELGLTIDGYFGSVKHDLAKRLGSYEEMGALLAGSELDSIVIALEPHETQHLRSVLSAAEKEGIRVELIPFYNDIIPAHPVIENVGKTRLIDLRATPLDNIGWAVVKRAVDIIGSLLGIALTSPLMIAAAAGVKLTSPGPVFFRQERVGRGKKPFKMLKFRSMRNDADHAGWTTDADSRKTAFGAFIRKYSIDELPQLFNVLIGQMSLVGPRPELPKFVRKFKESVPLYLVRQQVRPGMTGWAQVHGLRGDTSIDDRVEYDIWYIENWSLLLDIRILFSTVFGGKFKNEEVVL